MTTSAGMALRSPVRVGDPVQRDATVLAVIQPAEPGFLDARARAQAEAAVTEAQAAVRLARVNRDRAAADLDYARNQLARNRELAARGTVPRRVLEDSTQLMETHRAALEAANEELGIREAALARAEAQLVGPDAQTGPRPVGACCSQITAPQSGTVLSVVNESARIVQPGEPLLTIGNLAELEIEADLLSADAVRLAPGARAIVERWGGPGALEARVRQIEPRGFTRVSALGIEEQRVSVRLEFTGPPEERQGLGDAYRVFVRIVTWEAEEALQVPVSALFRAGEEWAVYRVEEGAAVLTPVTIGQRTQTHAQLLRGLEAGDLVIAYPGERVSEGTQVVRRENP